MILRQMPDLSNVAFREYFYARWGRENCVICADTRHAEYGVYRQRLSVKAAWNGREDYFVDNRRLAVDDDVYLILNDERCYSSRIHSERPSTSFSIFFRPGLANEILDTLQKPTEELLEAPDSVGDTKMEFREHLTRHDKTVSPLLYYLRAVCASGFDDETWYEEQLHVLLDRMLRKHRADLTAPECLSAMKRVTRIELHRRVARAADFIQSNFELSLRLDDLARQACLSSHHFLRSFRSIMGITPYQFLLQKRAAVAARMLLRDNAPVVDIGMRVGFDSRSAFCRSFKKVHGRSPDDYRQFAGN